MYDYVKNGDWDYKRTRIDQESPGLKRGIQPKNKRKNV